MNDFERLAADDFVWSGDSVFEPGAPTFPRSPNLEMMGQDVGANLFGQCRDRWGQRGSRFSAVSFRLEPENARVTKSFRTLLYAGSDDISYGIGQFLDMIGRSIVVDNRLVYELQIGRDKTTNAIAALNFRPASAPGDRLLVFGRHAVQLLSPSLAERHNCSRIRRLKPANTFLFQPPPYWRRSLGRARLALRFFDTIHYQLIDDVTSSISTRRQRSRVYDHSSNLKMLARETAVLGWPGRGLFRDHETDYLAIERRIQWNSFCVDLRNYMICELQRAVSRIAELLDCQCRLIVEETSEYNLEDIRKSLREGKTSTVELLRRLF